MRFAQKRCPHCGEKVKYFDVARRIGHVYFFCAKCKKFSFLVLGGGAEILFVTLFTLCIFIVGFCGLYLRKFIFGAILITFLFSLFVLLIPAFLKLENRDD